MKLFQMLRKNNAPKVPGTPAVRKSICTGEMTFGYLDAQEKFHEIQLVRTQDELVRICREYGVSSEGLKTVY